VKLHTSNNLFENVAKSYPIFTIRNIITKLAQ